MNKITNHLPTAELQALDAAHHMHPFTSDGALAKKGVRVITSGQGVWLTDSEGSRIIDGMAGLWCVNVGYGRGELADAAARQMRELSYYNTFFMTTHVPAIALAAKLAELAPGDLNHVFFASSGSEANDTNIRLVRRYWDIKGQPERRVIIARKNGYHGSTMGGGSLGGMPYIHAAGGKIDGIEHIGQPHWWAEGGEMTPEDFGLLRARELEEKILEIGADKVAAFIGEPIQGAGGVIVPPSTYWPEIQRICDKYGILLIVDEVITGFGRTGNWFACETFGIKPHIITIAKGLSSGYQPIGGSIVCDEVAHVIGNADDDFNHGYTYSGHPVASAVALENLRIIEEDGIIDHVRNVAHPYLAEKWHKLGEHPMVGQTSLVGLMGSIQLTPNKATRAKFAAKPGTIGFRTREHCFRNNLIMRHVYDRMIISPPLVITTEEIDVLIDRATRSLDAAYAEVRAEGLFTEA
ncbi:MAG: aspartate aminotransferase family protein [Rhodobacterales bacterium 65-51]|uniref:aspartate aminotransferase family protein n=1 Tax=uncultured Gemmobacter sp. TaxID=1095917 RepID=UPI000966F0E9|nr:aspartate aminotransferase family protein [uncultured Gemmobacter sp.]OJY27255.1 MAG: aspartate aminotransferase family protein [Rhodobacterales bacterium 65-51]